MMAGRLMLPVFFARAILGSPNAFIPRQFSNCTTATVTERSDNTVTVTENSDNTVTVTKDGNGLATDCSGAAPSRLYPFSYLPCESCSPQLVTDLKQPITSAAVTSGITTRYVAPFYDFNFQPSRTVTVFVDANNQPISQIQTWRASEPTYTNDGTSKRW